MESVVHVKKTCVGQYVVKMKKEKVRKDFECELQLEMAPEGIMLGIAKKLVIQHLRAEDPQFHALRLCSFKGDVDASTESEPLKTNESGSGSEKNPEGNETISQPEETVPSEAPAEADPAPQKPVKPAKEPKPKKVKA